MQDKQRGGLKDRKSKGEGGRRKEKEKKGENYGKTFKWKIAERESDSEEEGGGGRERKRKRKRYKEMKRLQKQQVSFPSGYEWLLHILHLCNLEEKREREGVRVAGWASNQMRGNLLFLRKHTLSFSLRPSLLTSPPSFVCSAAQKFLNMIMRGCQRCTRRRGRRHTCMHILE